MKKKIIIIIFVLTFVSFFGVYSWQKKQSLVSSTTSTSSVPQTNNQITEIDYSTLEKDRLYTEEEGKYVNLNDTGKKLLRTLLALPDCVANPTLSYCYEYEQQIKRSSIVALKDGIVLLNMPSEKLGSYYKIYDIKQNKNIGKQRWHLDASARNKELVIYTYDNNTSGQNIFYYRPGMISFALVPNSKISPTESYLYNVGMGVGLPDISFKNNVFVISIFNKNQPQETGGQSKKLREVTFNFSNIPVEIKKITAPVDISVWKKYKSKENNVEFKYPSTWKIIVGGNHTSRLWNVNKSENSLYFEKNLEAKIIMSTAEAFSPGGGNFIVLYKFSLINGGNISNKDQNIIEFLVGENIFEIEKYTTKYLSNKKIIFIKKHPENIGPAFVYVPFKKVMYVLETQNPGGGYSSKYLDTAVKIAKTITPL